MPHELEILESGIVKITHTGRLSIVEATASRNEAALLMRENHLKLVLADVSATEHDESTMDLYEFNASHYDVFPAGSRLAVVIPSDPAKADSARFAESVALNRGVSMRIFLVAENALEWLVSGAD